MFNFSFSNELFNLWPIWAKQQSMSWHVYIHHSSSTDHYRLKNRIDPFVKLIGPPSVQTLPQSSTTFTSIKRSFGGCCKQKHQSGNVNWAHTKMSTTHILPPYPTWRPAQGPRYILLRCSSTLKSIHFPYLKGSPWKLFREAPRQVAIVPTGFSAADRWDT